MVKAKLNDIGEIMIREQFFRMLSPELQLWIGEHNPATAAEAASLVDTLWRPGETISLGAMRPGK